LLYLSVQYKTRIFAKNDDSRIKEMQASGDGLVADRKSNSKLGHEVLCNTPVDYVLGRNKTEKG